MRESRSRLSLIDQMEKENIEKTFDPFVSETLDSALYRSSTHPDFHIHCNSCHDVVELQHVQLGEF
jgi:hypothetical protein